MDLPLLGSFEELVKLHKSSTQQSAGASPPSDLLLR